MQLALGPNELGEPMSLAILPNRSVVHTARDDTVRVTDAAGNTTSAGKLKVYLHNEEGPARRRGGPDFTSNRFIYLYYSPRLSTPDGDTPAEGTQADRDRSKGEHYLSRFVLTTNNTLDAATG